MRRSLAGLGGFFCCLLLTGSQGMAEESPVQVELALRVPTNRPVQGSLKLRPTTEELPPIEIPVESRKTFKIQLPAGTTWEASLDVPGFWAARRSVTARREMETVRFEIWPLGKLAGKIQVQEKDARLPKQLSVTTLAAPKHLKRPEVPKGLLDCPVDDQGAWTCPPLPATTFDLVVAAEGFIPHYRWGVQVPVGTELPLGLFELKKGASVAGWVAVEDGAIDPEKCVARLSPATAARAVEAIGLARTAVERKVGKDGFFQFAGVAPGSYTLEVQQPGFAPVTVPMVQVAPKAETFLRDPLLLKRPLRLGFSVVPPQDWLGQPWRLRVMKSPDSGSRLPAVVFEGTASVEGQASVPEQSAGTFSVTVLDSRGNQVLSEDVIMEGATEALATFEVDLVAVQGTVTLGDEPLSATVWFGGRNGAVSVKMESDGEGRFHGVLPRKNLWIVDVDAPEPTIRTRLLKEVRPNKADRATVEIALPDTRVFGRVVDENGRPVAEASVAFLASQMEWMTFTDEKGTFEGRALPEGPLKLAAEALKKTSPFTEVVLSEDQAAGPIELRLQATREIQGKILTPRGPVPGAIVEVLPLGIAGGGSGLTDFAGAFRVTLPERTQRAVAVVATPGSALEAFSIDLAAGEPVLRVRDEGGTLEFSTSSAEQVMAQGLVAAFYQNGLPLPFPMLAQWASRNGSRPTSSGDFRIPNLAPGEYQVCMVPRTMPYGPAPEGSRCVGGTLRGGEKLRLDLD